MSIQRDLSTPQNREFWGYIDATAKKVERYPEWKRGGKMSKLTDEKINQMASEVMGGHWHEYIPEFYYGNHCEVCEKTELNHFITTSPNFCTDLNAAQRLVKRVMDDTDAAHVGQQLNSLVWDKEYIQDLEEDILAEAVAAACLTAPAKTITLAALVAADRISLKDAKENL